MACKSTTTTKSTSTATFKVEGTCEMCKEKIEANAKAHLGVKKANYNLEKKELNVTYVAAQITPDVLQKDIAAIGYDTDKYKATDAAYKALPGCCKYKK